MTIAETATVATDTRVPFKMFGLQRTGTNLMVALMTRNFQVRSLEIGSEWKHGQLKVPDRHWNGEPARFVLCVKNPYAWLVSCFNYFRRANGGDGTVAKQFQRDPSVSFDEFALTPTYEFASPVHRWNQMYRRWLDELPEERTVIVRQEDQLHDQVRVLEGVEKKLGLHRQGDALTAIERKVDVNATLRGPMNRDYYIDREYMASYTPSLLDKVNTLLDPALLERFDYPRETWTLAERQIRGLHLTVRPCTSDAADARRVTFDPYRFNQIKQAGHPVRSYVDVGAHVGATMLLAKRLWPQCRVLAYEPCPENVRMVRINCRNLPQVTIVHAAITDGPSTEVEFSPGDGCAPERYPTGDGEVKNGGGRRVPAVSIDDALARLGEIDLLKIGAPAAVRPVVERLIGTGAAKTVPRIRGVFRTGTGVGDWLTENLGRTHKVQIHRTRAEGFFFADALA